MDRKPLVRPEPASGAVVWWLALFVPAIALAAWLALWLQWLLPQEDGFPSGSFAAFTLAGSWVALLVPIVAARAHRLAIVVTGIVMQGGDGECLEPLVRRAISHRTRLSMVGRFRSSDVWRAEHAHNDDPVGE
jgi:hypothetical protein